MASETYKAAVYDAPGKISTKVVDKPIPEPAAGDVLIRLYVLQLQQAQIGCKSQSTDNETFASAHTLEYATQTWVSC